MKHGCLAAFLLGIFGGLGVNAYANAESNWHHAQSRAARYWLGEGADVDFNPAEADLLQSRVGLESFANQSLGVRWSRDDMPTADIDLPSRLDWRSAGGRNFVSPVRDQGECGSCVSFAAMTTLETQVNIQSRSMGNRGWFSRQYFFSCGGGSCEAGWLLSDAVRFLSEHGVPDAACLAYQSGATGEEVDCFDACTDAGDRLFRIERALRPTTGFIQIDKIKKALRNGPLLTSMILYEDFLQYQGGVYKHTSGRQRGSHAVTIIGWDDAERAWIGRNSMGTDWGENGDFRISWDDRSLIGRYTYQFVLNENWRSWRGFREAGEELPKASY